MKSYKFCLERKRDGRPHPKYECPSCGRKKCFTRYINAETLTYVDVTCGKCDHEQSCGYHYTPRDYYREHPQSPTDRRSVYVRPHIVRNIAPAPLCAIDPDYVTRSLSDASRFVQWLRSLHTEKDRCRCVMDDYRLGATRDGAVIFWQIDVQQRVRTGKVMHYTPEGHRTGNPNWVHTLLQRQGELAEGWTLTQCLFGEHLLPSRPEDTVALVESEKSAVVCAMFFQQFVWLATGGCKGLTPEKLRPLTGRRVIVFPDSGCYDEWNEKLRLFGQNIKYSIVSALEQYPPNTDIADVAVGEVWN